MYYTLKGTESEAKFTYKTLADELSNCVLAFWNACIIEYCIVNQKMNGIQLNHEGDIAWLFITNYRAFTDNVYNRRIERDFVDWILSCPLMRCYVDPEFLMLVDNSSISWSTFEAKRDLRNSRFIKNEIERIEGLIKKHDEDIEEISGKINALIEAHSNERKKIILEEELNRKDLNRKEKEDINDEIKHIDFLIRMVKPSDSFEDLENIQHQQKMQRLRYVTQMNDLKQKLSDVEDISKKIESKYYKYVSDFSYNVYDLLTNQML